MAAHPWGSTPSWLEALLGISIPWAPKANGKRSNLSCRCLNVCAQTNIAINVAALGDLPLGRGSKWGGISHSWNAKLFVGTSLDTEHVNTQSFLIFFIIFWCLNKQKVPTSSSWRCCHEGIGSRVVDPDQATPSPCGIHGKRNPNLSKSSPNLQVLLKYFDFLSGFYLSLKRKKLVGKDLYLLNSSWKK